jgi:hypothetical protein
METLGDGGLRDLLVDSGVYAGNTAELMLVGFKQRIPEH